MKRRQKAQPVAEKQLTKKLKRSREPGKRSHAAAAGAPAGAAAVVAGRHLEASSAGNALAHEPTSGLAHEAANTLAHHATEMAAAEGVATEAVAAATGAGVALVAGTSVGAGAAGAGAAGVAGGAAAAGAQGAQTTLVVGAVATAAVAAVVVVVVATGDEPEVAEPAPTTTTTVAPEPEVAVPTQGPGLFETTTGAGPLAGNLLAEVDQNTEAGPLMIVGLQGQPTNVGVPVALDSGAMLTVDPLGVFQYVPPSTSVQLPAGESITDTFTYTVTNVDGFLEEWTAQVTVTGENQPPTIDEVPDVSVVEGESTSAELAAVDPEGETLSFSLGEGAPDFVSIVAADDGTASMDVSPQVGDGGSYQFEITVVDSSQPPQSTSTAVSIDVSVAPKAPTRVIESLLARYDFDEVEGNTIGERSGAELASPLTIADPSAVSWIDGALTINQPTMLTAGSATGLIEGIKATGSFTVEAWITPANNTQSGPARVVSISDGTGQRNVTLAQGAAEADGGAGDHWSSRQRSTENSVNGLPGITAPAGTAVAGKKSHVVLTRSVDGQARLYVDSVEVASGIAAGDLSNWDQSLPLVLVNETSGDRPWLGSLHLVAIYSRALSDAEVTQNYDVGAR